MDLHPYLSNNKLRVRVVPRAVKNKIVAENNILKVYLTASPEDGKANKELIAFFKKEFHLHLCIKSGAKSREKVLQVME